MNCLIRRPRLRFKTARNSGGTSIVKTVRSFEYEAALKALN